MLPESHVLGFSEDHSNKHDAVCRFVSWQFFNQPDPRQPLRNAGDVLVGRLLGNAFAWQYLAGGTGFGAEQTVELSLKRSLCIQFMSIFLFRSKALAFRSLQSAAALQLLWPKLPFSAAACGPRGPRGPPPWRRSGRPEMTPAQAPERLWAQRLRSHCP